MEQNPYFLLVVGLTTVFAVLLLVIYFGKLLIWCVNKFFPEEVKEVKQSAGATGNVDPTVRQAIEIAIRQVTGGKSGVQSIEKFTSVH